MKNLMLFIVMYFSFSVLNSEITLKAKSSEERDLGCITLLKLAGEKSKKNGEKFWNRLRIMPILSKNKELIYFAGEQNPIPLEQVRRYTFNKIID